jgi:molybdopterin converting factor small subunit
VRVLYFGPIQALARAPEDEVTLAPGATVRELVAELCARHGAAFREALLWPDGAPLPTVEILLDGSHIDHRAGMDTPIEDDGRVHVVIMPPAFGGG